VFVAITNLPLPNPSQLSLHSTFSNPFMRAHSTVYISTPLPRNFSFHFVLCCLHCGQVGMPAYVWTYKCVCIYICLYMCVCMCVSNYFMPFY
jgi:hypothetical protein